MSYPDPPFWGFGRGRPPAPAFQQGGQFPGASGTPVEGSDCQARNMDVDEDLFAYRGRTGNTGPPPNRLTAHVAPVSSGRRPGPPYQNEHRPPARFHNPGGQFQSGPPRRPPTSSHRFAADEYYPNASRYDGNFSRDDSYSESGGNGMLGDLMPHLGHDKFPPPKPEPPDVFRSRPVARNPSPERSVAPPSEPFQGFDRPRADSFEQQPQFSDDRYGPMPSYQPRDDRQTGRGPRREDPRVPRNAYDRSMYPPKGTNKTEDPRSLPAVYELPKIQKRVKNEEELNEQPEEKIVRLRVEHAKLEMRIQSLEKVVESAKSREAEFRRSCQGSALSDNMAFSDTIKLLTDAQRKLEAARQEYSFKDTVIKKLIQKPGAESKTVDKPKESVQVSATDFLDEKREEREEETDSSSKLEFFDGADHWCQQCNFFAPTVQEHLSHLHSTDHWAKNKVTATPPWPLIKRASTFDQDRSLAAIRGTQFIIPCHGFYCAICKVFQGDSEAAEEHLFSISHNKMVQRFFMSKPEYEHMYIKDRASAKSKADADARKQKREAEERRIREEEARKKAQEEETRKRENEIREKLMEDNKHMRRLRELEEKKEKEKLKKDRDRLKEKERERADRKRRNRVHVLSSDDEISSSDDDSLASPAVEDPKLVLPSTCFVQISLEEAEKALKCFNDQNRTVGSGKNVYTASSSDENAVWTQITTAGEPNTSLAAAAEPAAGDGDEGSAFPSIPPSASGNALESAGSQPVDFKQETESPKKLQIVETEADSEVAAHTSGGKSESQSSQDSPIEAMIMSALTDCLTPPVVTEDDEPPTKKHKKNRDIEVITGDDPNDEDSAASTSGAPNFPTFGLDDLVAKSP